MKFIILFLVPVIVLSQGIDDLKWTSRVVVIYAASFDNDQAITQLALLKKKQTQLKEYHLTLVEVTNEGRRRDGGKVYSNNLSESIKAFKVQLIGLDGGIKLESATPVAAQQIFELIETMPMRRR